MSAPRIVLATGSEPAVPAIPGLAGIPFLTNETIFALDVPPSHLVAAGGRARLKGLGLEAVTIVLYPTRSELSKAAACARIRPPRAPAGFSGTRRREPAAPSHPAPTRGRRDRR